MPDYDDQESDMALAALLTAAREAEPSLDEGLLKKAYAIQRRHQFDRDGERESLQDLNRLVEQFIESGEGSK